MCISNIGIKGMGRHMGKHVRNDIFLCGGALQRAVFSLHNGMNV